MNIIPLVTPVQVHTKYSRMVKTALTQEARRLGVPQNTVANTILARHYGITGQTQIVKKTAKRTKTRRR